MNRLGDTVVQILRDAAKGQRCIRCGSHDDTVVGAHYTGFRRLAYGGGLGRKVHDLAMAHLCQRCHEWMDRLSRNKEDKVIHSEEFNHLCLLTILRLYEQNILLIKGQKR